MCGLFRCFQRLFENCLFFHKEVSCLLLQKRASEWMLFFFREGKTYWKYMQCSERLIGEQRGVWGCGFSTAGERRGKSRRKKQATWSSRDISKCWSLCRSGKRSWWGWLWGREGTFVGEFISVTETAGGWSIMPWWVPHDRSLPAEESFAKLLIKS